MRVLVSGPRPPAPAPIAPAEVVERLKTAEPERLKDRAPVKTARAAAQTPRAIGAKEVVEAAFTLPPQPAVAVPSPSTEAAPSLPLIGQQDALPAESPGQAEPDVFPTAPADGVSTTYPHIKPFGKAVVYALLLDASGTVQDVRIVVPSADTLADLGYAMAMRGARVALEPPLAPGELRWIETKIDYRSKNEEVLP